MLYLQQLCDACDESEFLRYKQWESTDRTTLIERVQELDEYLETLVQKTDLLTTHQTHHSVFYRPDALPAAQPTVSKH